MDSGLRYTLLFIYVVHLLWSLVTSLGEVGGRALSCMLVTPRDASSEPRGCALGITNMQLSALPHGEVCI